jgi:hypothetical protein
MALYLQKIIYLCGGSVLFMYCSYNIHEMSEMIKFLINNYPYGIWLIAGGSIVWLYWMAKSSSDKARDIASDVAGTVKNLPCERHREMMDNQKDNHRDVDLKIEKINANLIYMNKMMDDMSRGLTAMSQTMGIGNLTSTPPMTQRMSPLMLTEEGKGKVAELGIEEMIGRNWEKISSLIAENTNSRNPYDIQQFILEETSVFPEKFLNPEDIGKVKLDAYKTGEILQAYMRVISVLVRDRYFKEYNINLDEVDLYAPNPE